MAACTTTLRRLTRGVICACLLLASATSQAVIVEGTVSAIGGGMYHYEFSITNDELEDLVLVSITDAPLADPSIGPSLLEPIGFLSNYDNGLGIVDWLADTDLFAVGTTIGGFSFNSLSLVPASFTRFSALDALGNQFGGDIHYTVAPPPAGVPEPATVWLFMLGLSALALGWRRLDPVTG